MRGNARRFLERALLISALVHLSAAGLFRAAERVDLTREGPPISTWNGPVYVEPPMLPNPSNWGHVSSPSDKGVIEPVPREVPFPTIDPGTYFRQQPTGVAADPRTGPDQVTPPGPSPPGGPRVFVHADTPPVPIAAPKPPYPEWAREAGIEGKVLLRVLVGADGFPKSVIIESGPNGLQEEARNAVMRWKFQPGLSNGIPIAVWVRVPVTYSLSER